MDTLVKLIKIGGLAYIIYNMIYFFGQKMIAKVFKVVGITVVIAVVFPAISRVSDQVNTFHQDIQGVTNALQVVGNTRNSINDTASAISNNSVINFGGNAKLPAKSITEFFTGGHLSYPIANGQNSITQKFNPPDHHGLDIACDSGTAIKASFEGTVAQTGFDPQIYGNYVLLEHGNGFQTMYAHCSEIKTERGKHVYGGDLVALSGNTGNSEGPHLHFEVRYSGKATDPLKYLK